MTKSETQTLQDLIACALSQRKDSIFYTLSSGLNEKFSDRALLETESHLFQMEQFAWEGHCVVTSHPDLHQQWTHEWDHEKSTSIFDQYTNWRNVVWNDHQLEVITIGILGSHCRDERHYILAESEEIAQCFFEAVCAFASEIRSEILVFSEGNWQKSKDLFESIQRTTFESLVLPEGEKEVIESDFRRFFESRAAYEKHGIPWKRGVLFMGPPGNGKTHTVKALVNSLRLPCLYVRSFQAEYMSDQRNISAVFSRARGCAPCLLILEDLDSLITDENRSYFLNELDGFHQNTGIVAVGTTNHPERLDPAILHRPSRFDRKFSFAPPGLAERKEYLQSFTSSLEKELQLACEEASQIAEATADFSYAYLKELVLSSMMAWIAAPKKEKFVDVMCSTAKVLHDQIGHDEEGESVSPSTIDPYASIPARYRKMMRRRGMPLP